jgi:hypothetical protein
MPKEMPTPKIDNEIGYTGLKINSGRIYENSKTELVFPYNIDTYDKMCSNITIASALNTIKIIASRAQFAVEPYNLTTTHVNRGKFLEECLDDMEHSWYDFIREAMSFPKYGFSIHEKVYRYRRSDRGSKYDDGRIGIRKLPIRSQASVFKWKDDGVVQRLIVEEDDHLSTTKEVKLPFSKLLHFRNDPYKGNPEGTSILNSCYMSWKMLVNLLDNELIATAKNLNGIPKFKIPAKYMSPDASEADKAVYENLKQIGANTNNGEQAFVIIPSDVDENGKEYFGFDVVDSSSSNISAVSPIIQRYTNEILQCLFADILQMGTEKGGNYNVVESKASLLEIVVEYFLTEICEVFNRNLIPELWELNGWDKTKTPRITFGELSRPDLAVFAKALQQLSATNNIIKSAVNLNYIQEVMGLPDRIDEGATPEEIQEALGVDWGMQSRSGDGLNKQGDGTSDEVSKDDNSASNLDNK